MSGKPFAQVEKTVALAKQNSDEPTIIVFKPHVTLFSKNSHLNFHQMFCFLGKKRTRSRRRQNSNWSATRVTHYRDHFLSLPWCQQIQNVRNFRKAKVITGLQVGDKNVIEIGQTVTLELLWSWQILLDENFLSGNWWFRICFWRQYKIKKINSWKRRKTQ